MIFLSPLTHTLCSENPQGHESWLQAKAEVEAVSKVIIVWAVIHTSELVVWLQSVRYSTRCFFWLLVPYFSSLTFPLKQQYPHCYSELSAPLLNNCMSHYYSIIAKRWSHNHSSFCFTMGSLAKSDWSQKTNISHYRTQTNQSQSAHFTLANFAGVPLTPRHNRKTVSLRGINAGILI